MCEMNFINTTATVFLIIYGVLGLYFTGVLFRAIIEGAWINRHDHRMWWWIFGYGMLMLFAILYALYPPDHFPSL